MFVLGIDPGLTRTGYGILHRDSKGVAPVLVGVVRTDPADPIGTRLSELFDDITGLTAEYEIDAAAIESVFSNRNRQTATGVGRASGVILLALARAGIGVTEYTPSAVKMALTGFGAADKTQVQRVVQMRLGLEEMPRPADAADALAIGLCHVQSLGFKLSVANAGGAL